MLKKDLTDFCTEILLKKKKLQACFNYARSPSLHTRKALQRSMWPRL